MSDHAQGAAAIVFDDVSAGYNLNQTLLVQARFGVARGDWVYVIGAPASGKSLLHHLILRKLSPSSGRIFVFGKVNASGMAQETVAQVAQYPVFWEDKSLYANLAAPMIFGSYDDAYSHGACMELLQWLGLADMAERPMAQLSTSERQITAIARALVALPKLLLLDEPFQFL
ncbi:MAG: ATP-binding cassette domain-containing protein, partial [Pseudomonadota bacterium]